MIKKYGKSVLDARIGVTAVHSEVINAQKARLSQGNLNWFGHIKWIQIAGLFAHPDAVITENSVTFDCGNPVLIVYANPRFYQCPTQMAIGYECPIA